jgi:uncharacterized protein (DUF934 family)
MRVIQNKSITDIDWLILEEDQSPVENAKLIVPFARFVESAAEFLDHEADLGVLVPVDISVDELADYLPSLQLVAVEIPKYPDGRAFSQARLLRDKYQFEGDILAVGDILRDQVADLIRCGVNMIAYTDSRDIDDALVAFSEFTRHYQPPVQSDELLINKQR